LKGHRGCHNPLPRPYVAPGDRQVSPSLRTLQAGLLLSQGRGSNGDGGLRHHIGVRGPLEQAGRLTSRARVRPAGSTRTGESSLPAVNTSDPFIPAKRRPLPRPEAECVAGAKRSRAPEHHPEGDPSQRANASSGGARRAERCCCYYFHTAWQPYKTATDHIIYW